MRKEDILKISYSMMVARVALSFLSWINVFLAAIIVSLLDLLDGALPWLKKMAVEKKQQYDYISDMVSRAIFMVPLLMWVLPIEHMFWFVLVFIWYFTTTIARVVTHEPWFVAFTAPVNILLITYFGLPMVGLPLMPWIIFALLIGMIYEIVWHKTVYVH